MVAAPFILGALQGGVQVMMSQWEWLASDRCLAMIFTVEAGLFLLVSYFWSGRWRSDTCAALSTMKTEYTYDGSLPGDKHRPGEEDPRISNPSCKVLHQLMTGLIAAHATPEMKHSHSWRVGHHSRGGGCKGPDSGLYCGRGVA